MFIREDQAAEIVRIGARLIDAIESIADSLTKIANPSMIQKVEEKPDKIKFCTCTLSDPESRKKCEIHGQKGSGGIDTISSPSL